MFIIISHTFHRHTPSIYQILRHPLQHRMTHHPSQHTPTITTYTISIKTSTTHRNTQHPTQHTPSIPAHNIHHNTYQTSKHTPYIIHHNTPASHYFSGKRLEYSIGIFIIITYTPSITTYTIHRILQHPPQHTPSIATPQHRSSNTTHTHTNHHNSHQPSQLTPTITTYTIHKNFHHIPQHPSQHTPSIYPNTQHPRAPQHTTIIATHTKPRYIHYPSQHTKHQNTHHPSQHSIHNSTHHPSQHHYTPYITTHKPLLQQTTTITTNTKYHKSRHHNTQQLSGSRFKMSYQYMKSHCGDKTVVRSSYLHNGVFYTGKTASLYWIGPLQDTGDGKVLTFECFR